MKIRQLECFCALAETLNFTKAAQQIYMTQSVFSKNIASLEHELGCTLITRSKVSPVLTEAGTRIYARAKGIVRDAEENQKIAGDARRGELLTIRIGLLWYPGGFIRREGYFCKKQRDNFADFI